MYVYINQSIHQSSNKFMHQYIHAHACIYGLVDRVMCCLFSYVCMYVYIYTCKYMCMYGLIDWSQDWLKLRKSIQLRQFDNDSASCCTVIPNSIALATACILKSIWLCSHHTYIDIERKTDKSLFIYVFMAWWIHICIYVSIIVLILLIAFVTRSMYVRIIGALFCTSYIHIHVCFT